MRIVLIAGLVVLTACVERERPSPTSTGTNARLSVEMFEPRQGATVVAGREIEVRVSGRDLTGQNLAGLGFVVRRAAGGGTLDSVAIRFAVRGDSTHTFRYTVPATLPTNAQLDLFGIAFGPSTQTRTTDARNIVVARCAQFQAGCG